MSRRIPLEPAPFTLPTREANIVIRDFKTVIVNHILLTHRRYILLAKDLLDIARGVSLRFNVPIYEARNEILNLFRIAEDSVRHQYGV